MQYQAKEPFTQKHLLTLQDWSEDEIYQCLSLALKLKSMQKSGEKQTCLSGKTLAMIFAKSSTRTRVSFEVGTYQLGGSALFLSTSDIQLGRGEPISDTAQVLSRMVDGIMIRTFKQSDLEALAKHGSIPIINGLTDEFHPCQVLADLLTIYEKKGTLKGLKLAFVGDGNNMANSLMIGCSKLGIDVSIASPDGYKPSPIYTAWSVANAEAHGSKVTICSDPLEACKDADVLYTDVWASMGQESEAAERKKAFEGYQINAQTLAVAKKDCIFLHCLPAHRGEEVSADVIDGKHSVVFDEAENRLHAQKAVMALLMGGGNA
ncbi:MAG: ornithine carbamoyltransferase [Clostridiales bacterium]|nr:ornithine carbamoyltransferase [Clostridiales bacterium]